MNRLKNLEPSYLLRNAKLKFDVAPRPSDKICEVASVIIRLYKKPNVSIKNIANWLNILPITVKSGLHSHFAKHYNVQPLIFKKVVQKNVDWFTEHQSPIKFSNLTENYIQELLLSNLSLKQISDDTDVTQANISYLRSGKRKISNLSINVAHKLANYYKLIKPWASKWDLIHAYLRFNSHRSFMIRYSTDMSNHPCITPDVQLTFNGNTRKYLEHGEWLCLYNTNLDNHIDSATGVIIDNLHPNVLHSINQKQLPKQLLNVCKRYASVLPKYRTDSDEAYMLQDLKHKQNQSLNTSYDKTKFNHLNWHDIRFGTLPYESATRPIDKLHETYGVIKELHQHKIDVNTIANWLNLFPVSVQDTLKQSTFITYPEIVQKNVQWFLRYQKPCVISNNTKNYIIELLLSKIPASTIAKDTGLSQPTISYLREGKAKLSKLSVATAHKLANYYKLVKPWISRSTLYHDFFKIENKKNYPSFIFPIWNTTQNPVWTHHQVPKSAQHMGIPLDELQKLCYGNWFILLYLTTDTNNQNHAHGIVMNQDKPNVWWSINHEKLLPLTKLDCKQYAQIPIQKRSDSDEQYMLKDLKHRNIKFLKEF